jgi:hypothetical protein
MRPVVEVFLEAVGLGVVLRGLDELLAEPAIHRA